MLIKEHYPFTGKCAFNEESHFGEAAGDCTHVLSCAAHSKHS